MRDRFLAAWRTAAQALFALVLAWLFGKGIHVPESLSAPAELGAIAIGAGVWAGLTHWLQSRTGNAWYDRAARVTVQVLLLGAATAPQYSAPAK